MKQNGETVPARDRAEGATKFMITGFSLAHGGAVLEAYGNGLFRSTEPLADLQGTVRFASAVICVNVLRPFAIEHFLKGLSVNSAGTRPLADSANPTTSFSSTTIYVRRYRRSRKS